MRVLYITPYVPSRIRVRPYNLIKSLSRRHEVTLVALVQSDYDRQALGEMAEICASVKPVRMSKPQSLASCGRKLFTRMPLQAAYTCLPEFARAVDDLVAREAFDVLHVEHVRGAHFAAHVTSLPKVYDSVDCITLLLSQFLKTRKNPLAWFLALEEWAKMRVYEAMIAERFEKVVITTQRDRAALESLIWDRVRRHLRLSQMPECPPQTPGEIEEWRVTRQLIEMSQDSRLAALMPDGGRVSVLPNGVDFDYFAPTDIHEEPETIIFSGKMSYCANVAAVKYFCESILPLVRARAPNVRFLIVGADPPASVRRLAEDPFVMVTGYVPDIRPYIARAAVAVSPITVGVGIQNKVLEAMAMAKPVVATSRACGAIAAANGRDILQADLPDQFARHVSQLLASQAMRREIGDNAARYVRANHDWNVIGTRLAEIYAEAGDVFEAEHGESRGPYGRASKGRRALDGKRQRARRAWRYHSC